MKINLYTVALLLITTLSFSQAPAPISRMIYLDSLWKETTEGNHKYYRIVTDYYSVKDTYTVNDFYKSGTLQMTGTTTNRDYIKEKGSFVYYYENGKKKSVSNYNEGRKIGKEYSWHENGNKKLEGEYISEGKEKKTIYKINQFWDSNNNQTVTNGNGYYSIKEKDHSDSGKIRNGLKDSIWTGNFDNLKFKYTETYKDGKLVSGISTDSINNTYSYTEPEIKPQPPKGIEHFYKYISNRILIPQEAKVNRIAGKIIIRFSVEENGSIAEIEILKELGHGLDEEIIRVLKNYPKWIPGTRKGIISKATYTIPISIVVPN